MKKISSKSRVHPLLTVHTTQIHIRSVDYCHHNKGQSQVIKSLAAALDWAWVLEISHHYPLINSNYQEIMVNRILTQQVLIQNHLVLIMAQEDWQLITIWWYMATETTPLGLHQTLSNSSNSSTWVLNLRSPSLIRVGLLHKKMVEVGSLHLSTSSCRSKTKKNCNKSWVVVSSLEMRELLVLQLRLTTHQTPTSLKIIELAIHSYRMAVE
jgi:hypothetical protein